MTFQIDPQLEAETEVVRDLPLSRVLLNNNALFPWLILVPRKVGMVEICDLAAADRHQLWEEICDVSDALRRMCSAHKINTAALGNKVRQLHVHVIARQIGDACWPEPVWGGPSQAYNAHELEQMMENLRLAL